MSTIEELEDVIADLEGQVEDHANEITELNTTVEKAEKQRDELLEALLYATQILANHRGCARYRDGGMPTVEGFRSLITKATGETQ